MEQRRQAITLQTARQVTGLTRPVTASVGLLELPDALCGAMSFDEMYRRADKLLYEAKNAGRNRMVAERLTVFTPETGAAVA